MSEALFTRFEKLINHSPDLEHVIVSGDNPRGYRLFEDLIGADEPEPYTAPTTCDDIAFWLYTSGSTGKPKGAVHVHASLKLTADLYGTPVAGLKESDVCYSVAKLFFAYGLGNAMTFPLTVGATTVLNAERPTPDGVAALLRKHPITVFFAVPTYYAAFLASPNAPQKSEVKIRRCISAGEALPEDIARRWKERYGVEISDELARPKCCTSISPMRRARPNTAQPASQCRAMRSSWSATTAIRSKKVRWASFMCAGRRARSCIGITGRKRAPPSRANGPVPATNTSRMPTAITSAADGRTTCSRIWHVCFALRGRGRLVIASRRAGGGGGRVERRAKAHQAEGIRRP